jgi:indole-3-glycerol phosphate synthase
VRRHVSVPVLRKDFIVDGTQVREAATAGADAILLIARALEPSRAAELAHEALELGLGVLFEVRDENELARGIAIAPAVIGINTRNLETLEVDPAVATRLVPSVPAGRIAVYESGVAERRDVEAAATLGASAVLVGSALSAHHDPVGAVRALAGVPRRVAS